MNGMYDDGSSGLTDHNYGRKNMLAISLTEMLMTVVLERFKSVVTNKRGKSESEYIGLE